MKSFIATLALAVGTIMPAAKAADTTEGTNQHEQKGSTKVHGKTWITDKENGTIVVAIEVTTKKSGLNGTGWGCTQIVFLNAKNEVVLNFNHTETVGAKVPEGINEGESKKDFTIRKAKADEITHWAVYTEIEDNKGFPKSIEKLKEGIQKGLDDLGGLGKIELRKQVGKDGTIFFKRK